LFEEIDDLDRFDLIYFDAFGYRATELWTLQYSKKYDAKNNGVTYAARGVVKSMIEVGFKVEISRSSGKECFVQENSSEFVVIINFLKSGLTQSNNNHNYTLIISNNYKKCILLYVKTII
jgi:hypothetical protein